MTVKYTRLDDLEDRVREVEKQNIELKNLVYQLVHQTGLATRVKHEGKVS